MWWWRNNSYPRDAAVVPGTEEIVRAGSVEQVWELWSARCEQFGLKFDNILATFSDCCCQALPESQRAEACSPVSEATPEVLRQKRLIGWSDITAFFAKAWDWFKSGECVPQEEADRRAAICAACPLNVEAYLPGCKNCSNLAATIFKFIGDKRTASDAALKSCAHCGCVASVIVWCDKDILVRHETHLPSPPAWCWKA